MNLEELLSSSERPSFDEYFCLIAGVVASRSTCARRKVGAILVDSNNRILSTGYNGVARGLLHCTDSPCPGVGHKSGQGLERCEAIHAEVNALVNCSDHLQIHALYCTTSPCISCTKLLMNTTCQRIVFINEYPNNGYHLWEKMGRAWEKLYEE